MGQQASAATTRVAIEIGHTPYASALSIFGCPIRCTNVRSLRTDQQRTLWHVTPVPAACHADIRPRQVLDDHRAGLLPADHMFRDALRGIANRRALRKWRATGEPQRLGEQCPGRWIYGDGPAAADDGTGLVRVEGEDLAAALGAMGCPAVRPEAGGCWIVRERGLPQGGTDGGRRASASALCLGLETGRLREVEPNHPFLCSWQGAVNHRHLVSIARQGIELLLVESPVPRCPHHAYMPTDAPGKAWDRCRRFLLGR